MGFFKQSEVIMMAFDPRDPDAVLVATFRPLAVENLHKSKLEGRPIFDDMEVCEIRVPGSRDVKVFPANTFSDWVTDPYTGSQVKRTYAERFAHQYRQFKAHFEQTKSGTPLTHVPFLTEGRRAELRALNIYTIEQLAAIDGQELKNIGLNGREQKNKAVEYIEQARISAPNIQMQAELDAMRSKMELVEEDNKLLAQKVAAAAAAMTPETSGDATLDGMTDGQLKDFVAANTGTRPIGNPARKTLLRMAFDARPTSKAA